MRALLSLLSELQARPPAPAKARERLLTGLRELVEAAEARWLRRSELPGAPAARASLLGDGSLLLDLGEGGDDAPLCLLLRPPAASPFADSDLRLLAILGEERRWLLPPLAAPRAGVESLSPRRREVLDLLLGGLDEREIARRLELSPHTIHECVVYLYRRFGVRSRGELLARFISR